MHKTKAEHAYEKLKGDIISGRYSPEEPMRLAKLSQDIEVSTVPVREALVQLERERLLVQTPHQGYSVAPMSMSEFEELVALRRALEEMVIPYVLAKITEQGFAALSDLVARMRSHLDPAIGAGGDRDRYAVFVSLNRKFHVGIAEASGLTLLPPILGNILDLSQRYINTIENHYGIREVDILEHEAILESIRVNDPETLRAIYGRHYQRIIDEFTSYMDENGIKTFDRRERGIHE